MAELCPHCDFASGQRGMDRCSRCNGTGRLPRYSHDYACTLSDGTPYRLGIVRGSSGREVHVEDAERIVTLLHADDALAEKNWLVAFMLPPPADWVSGEVKHG